MLPPRDVADVERESSAARRPPSRPVWPPRSRFDASTPPGPTGKDLTRRSAVQGRVRPMVVEPGRVAAELPKYSTKSHRNEQLPETLLLHRADEPLDDGEAGRLAEESESATYAPSPAPAFVRPARELSPLVGHDASWRLALPADRLAEERLYLDRCRHLREDRESCERPGRLSIGTLAESRKPPCTPPPKPLDGSPRGAIPWA